MRASCFLKKNIKNYYDDLKNILKYSHQRNHKNNVNIYTIRKGRKTNRFLGEEKKMYPL